MTDYIVKRLRDLNDHMNTFILDEAADRIEQLNSSSEGWKEIADEYFDAIGERNTRIEKLEAALLKIATDNSLVRYEVQLICRIALEGEK